MDMNLCLGTRSMVNLRMLKFKGTYIHQSHFFQVGSHLSGLHKSWDTREVRTRRNMGTILFFFNFIFNGIS